MLLCLPIEGLIAVVDELGAELRRFCCRAKVKIAHEFHVVANRRFHLAFRVEFARRVERDETGVDPFRVRHFMQSVERDFYSDFLVVLCKVHHVDDANAGRVHEFLVEEFL